MLQRREILKMTKTKNFAWKALVILGLSAFLAFSFRTCSQADNTKLAQELSMEKASKDSITKEYNKSLESWTYSKSTYVAERDVLQKELKKYSHKLDSVLKSKPKADAVMIVNTVTKIDTVWKSDSISTDAGKPVYHYSIKEELQDGVATAYPDSLKLKLQLKTGLVGVFNEGRLEVTPTNPNVTITGMEGFQVWKPKEPKLFWRGIGIGVGVGVVATAIILGR